MNEILDWMKRLSECNWLYYAADDERWNGEQDTAILEVAIYEEFYHEMLDLLEKYNDDQEG